VTERSTLTGLRARFDWRWLLRCLAIAIAAAGLVAAYHLPGLLHEQHREAAALVVDRLLGATVEPLDDGLAADLDIPPDAHGVVVTSLAEGRPADRAGLRAGDLIEQIGARPVDTIESAARALRREQRASFAVMINRHGHDEFVTVNRG
jgi:S1-C subfamily serine protease